MTELDAMFDEYTPLRPESQKLANFRIVHIVVGEARSAFGLPATWADAVWNGHEWINLDHKSKATLMSLFVTPSDFKWTWNTPITKVIENDSAKL